MKHASTRYSYGARDPEARHARATYNKLNERQRTLHGPQLVPSKPVMNAVRYAVEAGIPRPEIARKAEMSDEQLRRLMRGMYPRMRYVYRERIFRALKDLAVEQEARMELLRDSLTYNEKLGERG